MKIGVVVFPGSNCDHDCQHIFKDVLGQYVEMIWHKETLLAGLDAIVLPGGFSYGDYLRTGAIARFSPVMGAVKEFAKKGGMVLGICNGFQILLEAGLLPGAMLRNKSLQFICKDVSVKVENAATAFTGSCESSRCSKFRSPMRMAITIPIRSRSRRCRPTRRSCSAFAPRRAR